MKLLSNYVFAQVITKAKKKLERAKHKKVLDAKGPKLIESLGKISLDDTGNPGTGLDK